MPVRVPQPVSGDPLTLSVPVSRLGRGVYTVDYRAVAAACTGFDPGWEKVAPW